MLDRGFIFGDGIYEVVPVYGGVPFRWPQHLARLERSLGKVRIDNPMDAAGWTGAGRPSWSRGTPGADQFVYLQVTRGVARRDHAFPKGVDADGVRDDQRASAGLGRGSSSSGVAAITLPDERWLHCDIKSISLLGNVLARQAAVDAGAIECVMFRDGWLTEGSASNVWTVRGGTVLGAAARPR